MQTYTIPQGTKELTIETYNDKIVIEFVPEKTFKTEDGTIKFGDDFWDVNKELLVAKGSWKLGDKFICFDGHKIFSSEQAARQYVAEKKWEPKDGEVIATKWWIAMFQKGTCENYHHYFSCKLNGDNFSERSGFSSGQKDFRLATPSEAQLLFDKLAEAGYRWNAEEKKAEKVRWRAENGGNYWTIINGRIDSYRENKGIIDNEIYESGLYFHTRTQAEAAFEAVKNLLLNTEF